MSTVQATHAIEELKARHEAKEIDDNAFIEQLETLLNEYKEEASKIILKSLGAAAYSRYFKK